MFPTPNKGDLKSDALWQEAERRVREHQGTAPSDLGTEDTRVLIHELEVHQAELEVQNEELRRTQTQLAEALDNYQDLYEFAPVGYMTLDGSGMILQANLTASILCGVDRSHLIHRRIETLVAGQDHDSCYILLRETAASGRVRTRQLRLKQPDGQTRWVDVTVSQLLRTDEKGTGFRVALSDIHERKMTEEALAQSDHRTEKLAETLARHVVEHTAQMQALAGQLSQAEQRERKRLATVLHDGLQQLLVAAKYNLGILRRQVTDDKQIESVGRVNELLEESVATSRSLTAEMNPPILHRGTIYQVLQWLARWMQEKHGLSVHLEVDEKANILDEHFRVLVFGIVRELLLNTVKHAGVSAASVRVTRADGNRIQVVVEDEGAGFDPQSMQPDEAGAFGLYGVRERLVALAGRIEIDSAPGRGTRITLIVPADLQTAVTTER